MQSQHTLSNQTFIYDNDSLICQNNDHCLFDDSNELIYPISNYSSFPVESTSNLKYNTTDLNMAAPLPFIKQESIGNHIIQPMPSNFDFINQIQNFVSSNELFVPTQPPNSFSNPLDTSTLTPSFPLDTLLNTNAMDWLYAMQSPNSDATLDHDTPPISPEPYLIGTPDFFCPYPTPTTPDHLSVYPSPPILKQPVIFKSQPNRKKPITPKKQPTHACPHPRCDKKFTRPYNLASHMRTHTDERPFACGDCGRRFARQHDRNRHEKVHWGIKPYACMHCKKMFARLDALNRHLRIGCHN